MVEIRLTPKIQNAVDTAFACCAHDKGLLRDLERYRSRKRDEKVGKVGVEAEMTEEDSKEQTQEDAMPVAIPHSLVSRAIKALKTSNASEVETLSFDDVMKGSSMVFKIPPPREKSEKLKAILQTCQNNLDRQEYTRMTSNLGLKSYNMRDDILDAKKAMGAFGAVFNVLLSMGAVFTAIMYFGTSLTSDVGTRVLIGLFAALVVAIAEGWFLSRDLLRVDAASSKNVR
ncbi:endoplasmic reticulum-based factor for assembly of V-ATPase-domain-containing protein [Chytridium lagenaria]|nr:endoplasmic reticulum-based factor for assembly of V-ATPase-domain-containing protein [Chytridium lagenaria]